MLSAYLCQSFLPTSQLTHDAQLELPAVHSSLHACSPLLGCLSQYTAHLGRASQFVLSGHKGTVHSFETYNVHKIYYIGQNIRQIIGQVAIKGCLMLLVPATMMSFKGNRCYSVEVAMARLNEVALRRLIKGGETTTVEFKVAIPRPVEMAERLCGMANAQGGMIIIGLRE
jgi:Schlafen, AlbA_2